jgi:hypothetical protein
LGVFATIGNSGSMQARLSFLFVFPRVITSESSFASVSMQCGFLHIFISMDADVVLGKASADAQFNWAKPTKFLSFVCHRVTLADC